MRVRKFAAVLAASLAVLGVTAASAAAAPDFAPAGEADVRPGSMTYTGGGQCTSNFVFSDGADKLYLGQAAHCASTGAATVTNGCEADSRPLGTKVEIEGASRPGTLVYSSWLTMQEAGEKDESTCQFNDFALVEIDPADFGEVNPTVPFFGGPVGISDSTTVGERVYSYGNSSLRAGIELLKPKEGVSLGPKGDGWTHDVYTVTPGIPGDSGSGFLDSEGNAFGTLSTLALAPLPASNGVSDLSRELAYANRRGDVPNVTLAEGTEPFAGGRLDGNLLDRVAGR